jgi:hypothetical protein
MILVITAAHYVTKNSPCISIKSVYACQKYSVGVVKNCTSTVRHACNEASFKRIKLREFEFLNGQRETPSVVDYIIHYADDTAAVCLVQMVTLLRVTQRAFLIV